MSWVGNERNHVEFKRRGSLLVIAHSYAALTGDHPNSVCIEENAPQVSSNNFSSEHGTVRLEAVNSKIARFRDAGQMCLRTIKCHTIWAGVFHGETTTQFAGLKIDYAYAAFLSL